MPGGTLAVEGDYVVNRVFRDSPPATVWGGAGYARYQLTPKFALAGRFAYLSERVSPAGGLTVTEAGPPCGPTVVGPLPPVLTDVPFWLTVVAPFGVWLTWTGLAVPTLPLMPFVLALCAAVEAGWECAAAVCTQAPATVVAQ